MQTFQFAITATESIIGRALFQVQAETEQEARLRLVLASADYFTGFNYGPSETLWDDSTGSNFEAI